MLNRRFFLRAAPTAGLALTVSAELKNAIAGEQEVQSNTDATSHRAEPAPSRSDFYTDTSSVHKVKFRTVPLLLSDALMSYTSGNGQVAVVDGDVIEAGEFRYLVVARDATDDWVIATAGGVKLEPLPVIEAMPEMWGVSSDQSADHTAALIKIAAFSQAKRCDVRFASRKYNTSAQLTFTGSVRGAAGGRTTIQYTGSAVVNLVDIRPIDGTLSNVVVSDLTLDGNCSADPSAWTSANFNSFTGAKALAVTDATNVRIERIFTRNTVRAGISVVRSSQVVIENCGTTRSRGKYGDGLYITGSDAVTIRNVTATDYTRIGFVTEQNNATKRIPTRQALFENCFATDGHNSSILYGDNEYNAGFWAENSMEVLFVDCYSINNTHVGFVFAANTTADNTKPQCVFSNCFSSKTGSAFIASNVKGVISSCIFDNCRGQEVDKFIASGSMQTGSQLSIRNCSAELNGGAKVSAFLLTGLADYSVQNCRIKWLTLDETWENSASPYGAFTHVGNAPVRLVVEDFIATDSSNADLPVVFKFLAGALNSLDLTVKRCLVKGVVTNARRILFEDCIIVEHGEVRPAEHMVIRGGQILGRTGGKLALQVATKEILLDGVIIDLTSTGSTVDFFNSSNIDPWPKIKINNCRIKKNFEVNGPAIRLSGGRPAASTNNACHIIINGCEILNIGAATTKPIVQIDITTHDVAKVHGKGNLKSATLTAIANNPSKIAPTAVFEDWG